MKSDKFNLKERSHYGRRKKTSEAQHGRRSDCTGQKRWGRTGKSGGRSTERRIVTEEKQNLVSKFLRNAALWEIKVLPMFASFMVLSTLFLNYFDLNIIYIIILEEIYYAGMMAMLFTLSYLFKFCGYHRLFLWYIMVNHYTALLDTHYTIPLDDLKLLILYSIIAGIFSFLILRNYLKHKSHEPK